MTKFGYLKLTFGEVTYGEMTTVADMSFGKLTFCEMAFGDLTFVEMTSKTQNSSNVVLYCFCCVAPHFAWADNTGRSQ